MQDFIHITSTLTTLFAEITIEDTIQPFIAGIIFIGMIVALMLPILAIPYIFIKMGSAAAKLQSMGNNMVKRNMRKGANAGMRAGKDAYKQSGFKQARDMRKDSRRVASRQRALRGEGLSGALFKAEGAMAGRIPRTPGQVAGDRIMSEKVEEAQRKMREERIANAQSNLTPNAALHLSGGTPISPFNAADHAAVRYMQESGITAEPELASRALGSYLNQTGFMTADVNQRLVEGAGLASTDEGRLARAKVNDALNAEASKAGQHQYSYNSVDAAGNFEFAGQKIDRKLPVAEQTTANGIKNIIQSKGIAALPKELYSDDSIAPHVKTAIQELYTDAATQDQFMRGTLSLSKGKEVAGISKMLGMDVADFEAERQKYAEKYRGS